MHIYTGEQIKDWDTYTIEHEPIRSIDLMERAATKITRAIMHRWDTEWRIVVFAGPGNNGGDALAVARLLTEEGYFVEVYLFNVNSSLSDDCSQNKQRFVKSDGAKRFTEVVDSFTLPQLDDDTLVIDGLFGSGLNKPLSGGFASLAKLINASPADVVSIDMPSGLMTEDNTYNNRQTIIRADVTLTLGQRKLAMYLADNESYLGDIQVLDIGLSEEYVQKYNSAFTFVEERDIRKLLRRRSPFMHKGLAGHVLLVAGSYGMAGAVVLASRAVLRSGSGKLTIHSPRKNNDILQVAVPEAVLHHDPDEDIFSEIPDTADYDAVALGPGLGVDETTAIALMSLVPRVQCPVVLDADALNILAVHRPWINQLPRNLI
ncbi:MAG: NAD(P)H-hydrate epimerase, partial [Prevotella sp.]|nr:NAD(P)H-hydrate epimerase [Prevotella sp.]